MNKLQNAKTFSYRIIHQPNNIYSSRISDLDNENHNHTLILLVA